jgi:hypothetical protein
MEIIEKKIFFSISFLVGNLPAGRPDHFPAGEQWSQAAVPAGQPSRRPVSRGIPYPLLLLI